VIVLVFIFKLTPTLGLLRQLNLFITVQELIFKMTFPCYLIYDTLAKRQFSEPIGRRITYGIVATVPLFLSCACVTGRRAAALFVI
jgi:hypothetical protein